jgi:hypothetical protein
MEFGVCCSPAQMRKLKSGGAVTLKRSHFQDGSPHRIMVMPNTARRIQTAMRKDKGVRIALKPEEDVVAMTEGGAISMKGEGLKKALKKTGSVIKKGFETPEGRAIAKQLINIGTKQILPAAGSALSIAMGDPTGMSGQFVGNLAGDAIDKAAAKRGYGLKKIVRKAKKTLAPVIKVAAPVLKEVGKIALREGTAAAGEALSAYTGNPMAGEAFERLANAGGDRLIETGSAKSALRATTGSARNMGEEYMDDYMAGSGMGGLPRRTRGGLRMGQGMAHLTPAYSVAMRSTTAGAGFKVADGRMVTPSSAPSSVIQTGSPFQRMSSPAMSPYIPSSPQLAGQSMGRSGGSFYPAGRGGSFLPA